MFKNIGIFVKDKTYQAIDYDALDSLIATLASHAPNLFIDETSDYQNPLIERVSNSDFTSKIDLIIVFGGDGTLLSSTRKYLEFNIPLLGINMGTVGFLTDINTQNFDSVIQDILINNNSGPHPVNFLATHKEDWMKALDANMLSAIFMIKDLLP